MWRWDRGVMNVALLGCYLWWTESQDGRGSGSTCERLIPWLAGTRSIHGGWRWLIFLHGGCEDYFRCYYHCCRGGEVGLGLMIIRGDEKAIDTGWIPVATWTTAIREAELAPPTVREAGSGDVPPTKSTMSGRGMRGPRTLSSRGKWDAMLGSLVYLKMAGRQPWTIF